MLRRLGGVELDADIHQAEAHQGAFQIPSVQLVHPVPSLYSGFGHSFLAVRVDRPARRRRDRSNRSRLFFSGQGWDCVMNWEFERDLNAVVRR